MARGDGPAVPRPARRWPSLPWRRSGQPATAAVAKAPATKGSDPSPPPAPKKPRKSKAAAAREIDSVAEWKTSRTVPGSGDKVKPADAFTAYRGWCAESGQEPVSLTAFGTTMKGELGVVYEERSKGGFYTGLALVSAPKLVPAA
jgi:hypothetical protein